MIETMDEYHGIGLAAPQVHEGVRLFVAGARGQRRRTTKIVRRVVNPEIIATVGTETDRGLGRLPQHPRHPRHGAARPRHRGARARSRRQAASSCALKNFPARVVQHETDHLDGVLFFDRMASLADADLPRRIPALRTGRDDDEYRPTADTDAARRPAPPSSRCAPRRRRRSTARLPRRAPATRRASSPPTKSPTASATRSAR